jgi:hypothetical protein
MNKKISREKNLQNNNDYLELNLRKKLFLKTKESFDDKIDTFPKFASKKSLSRFLVRHELFKKILNIHGSIVDCGVLNGASLFTFAKLSSIYEPVNHTRKIIGFDTFSGFPKILKKDKQFSLSNNLKKRGLSGSTYEDILDAIKVYDVNRPLPHISKIEIVKGDIKKTSKEYLKKNPHTIISLLYLDLDLFEPTKNAIKTFYPLMTKGSIIAFDELNFKNYPGETIALKKTLELNKLKLHRFTIDPAISYVQI